MTFVWGPSSLIELAIAYYLFFIWFCTIGFIKEFMVTSPAGKRGKKMTVKQISGIHPYNDLFYRGCFFNCFFPIVKLYDQEVTPYLLNDQFAYGLTENGLLHIDWMSAHDPEKIK
ncbi:hypothetical protein ACEQPO_04720 [Bacillus sp. SL00103]